MSGSLQVLKRVCGQTEKACEHGYDHILNAGPRLELFLEESTGVGERGVVSGGLITHLDVFDFLRKWQARLLF